MKRYLIRIFGKEAYLTTNDTRVIVNAIADFQPERLFAIEATAAYPFRCKSGALFIIERLPKNYYKIETVYLN